MKEFIELESKFLMIRDVSERERALLNCIGNLINEFRNFSEIDEKAINDLLNMYNPILKEYNNLFPVDSDEENRTPLSKALSKIIREDQEQEKEKDSGGYAQIVAEGEKNQRNFKLVFGSDEQKLNKEIKKLIDKIYSCLEYLNDYYNLGVIKKNLSSEVVPSGWERLKFFLVEKFPFLRKLFGAPREYNVVECGESMDSNKAVSNCGIEVDGSSNIIDTTYTIRDAQEEPQDGKQKDSQVNGLKTIGYNAISSSSLGEEIPKKGSVSGIGDGMQNNKQIPNSNTTNNKSRTDKNDIIFE